MVAAAVVCHWRGRRLDSISRFATESYGSADDLLATATAARIWGYDIFRHLLLPWQRRCVPEPGVAIERRSRYPSVYEPISAGDARAMDNRFYCNYSGSTGEYVANGPGGSACIAGRHWPAFWPGIVAKTTRCAEERRHRRRACPYFGADCIGSSDSSGTIAQPLAIGERTNSCRRALASFTRGARRAAWRRIFRVRAGNVSRCVPRLQYWIRPRRSGKLEVFTRGLPADCVGMGMAGKQPLGVALLRRNSGWNS